MAIAFVIARTGQWLNDSMEQRNANFQATRTEAGQSNSLVRFREPSPINLIGPGARRTGGRGPQPPGSGPAACRPVVGGKDLLAAAQALRNTVKGMLEGRNSTQEWKLRTQQAISNHHWRAKQLIEIANNLLKDKERVDKINSQIPPYETAIRDLYAGTTKIKLCSGVAPCKEYTFANADLLADFMAAYGLDVDRLINAWWEVDQQLASSGPLNTTISDYNDRIKELKKLVTMINNLLWNDADGPDGTQYFPWVGITDRITQITNRISAIDRLLLDDADGSGALSLGINELITLIEGIPSNGLNDGWLEQIKNEEVLPCVTDPSCDADLLQFQMLVLEFVLSGNDTHGITKIEEFIADIDAQIGSCSDATCTTRLSTARNILTLMLSKSTATESYGLKDLGEALEFERNEKDYQVPGVDIPALDETPGLSFMPETVDGLEAEKGKLEERRDSLTEYRDDTLKPRIQVLTDEMAPYVAERKLLQQIDGHWNPWKGQAQIEGLEAMKQNIRTTWCRNTDIAVSHARGTCGLDCATVKPSALLWQAVDAWRASLEPLSTDPSSLAADPDSGQLACMAHQVKDFADREFGKANDLVDGQLTEDSESIQRMLDEAEELERQAREVCASL